MSRSAWSLLRSLTRRLPADGEPLPDADLLRRFAADRDQAAFEVLVWRHGGMVLGVCRRLLRDEHAAEDAFQATFLVLARKAGSVRGNLAGWLHRVARRVAIRASKRRKYERLAADPPDRPTTSTDLELAALLDAEIDRLPDRFRLPVVLCYLDGHRTEDAAKLLGVPRGTVLSRLATARQTLAARLTRRGVTLPATGMAATVTAEQVTASVSAAGRFVAGGLTGGTVQLANEVLHMGVRKQVIGWAAVLVATAGLGTGLVVGASEQPKAHTNPGSAAAPSQKPSAEEPKPNPPVAKKPPVIQDPDEVLRRRKAVVAMAADIERRMRQAQLRFDTVHREWATQVSLPVIQKAIDQLDVKIMEAKTAWMDRSKVEMDKPEVKEAWKQHVLSVDKLEEYRMRLVEQMLRRQQAEYQIGQIEDELAVYRELKRTLLRRQLQLEHGLDLSPGEGGRQGGDDHLSQLTRQIEELRSEVKRLTEPRK